MKTIFIFLFCFTYFFSFSQVEKNFDVISIGINSSSIDLAKNIENFINNDSSIKNIKTLEISGDYTEIPDCLYQFYWIEELIINSTKPIIINKSINKFKELENFKVLSEIIYISNKISLENIKRIDFDNYKSNVFPNFIFKQKQLEYLKIENSSIKKIPIKIKYCKNLKIVLFHNSKIKKLPFTFYKLKNLEVLGICSTPIILNYSKISKMKKLNEIYIDEKKINFDLTDKINFIFCQ